MTWPELIDRHWAPCYALALLSLLVAFVAVVWIPASVVTAARGKAPKEPAK